MMKQREVLRMINDRVHYGCSILSVQEKFVVARGPNGDDSLIYHDMTPEKVTEVLDKICPLNRHVEIKPEYFD